MNIQMSLNHIRAGKYLAQPQYEVEYSKRGEKTSIVVLPPGIPSRDEVISALIREEYSEDRMEAVINNYLLDMEDANAKAEFDVMQSFRKEAKVFADEIIKRIENENY